jgi:hypothetical protein
MVVHFEKYTAQGNTESVIKHSLYGICIATNKVIYVAVYY